MATLILGAAGNAILPGIGGFIGAAVGSVIDAQFVYPWLFGTTSIKGPRLDDLPIQVASEGSPMKWCLGPLNRVAGCLIWLPRKPGGGVDFIEVRRTRRSKGGRVTNYSYFVHAAIGINDSWQRPITRVVRVWADTKLIFDAATAEVVSETADSITYAATQWYDEMVVYKGTATQPIDPLMSSIDGEAATPRYKKQAYVRFTKFALAEFGNRIPTWNFQVEELPGKTVAQALSDIVTRAGFGVDEYDVSRVPGCLRGYVITGPQDGANVTDNLKLAYGVSSQQVGTVLSFFAKGRERPVVVEEEDLAVMDGGGNPTPVKVNIKECNFLELPREVTVTYSDKDSDLQQATKSSRRINLDSDVVLPLNFPLTLEGREAKNLAFRFAWIAEAECPTVELNLPPRYITLLEGDALEITEDDETYVVRAEEITRGENFRLEVRGPKFQKHLYTTLVAPVNGGGGTQQPYVPPEVSLFAFDGPAVTEAQVESAGIYAAACATDPDARWRGAVLFESADGNTYEELTALSTEATLGVGRSVLQDGSPLTWDEVNYLDVELSNGELESTSRELVQEGLNWAFIGQELIGFATATPTGTRRYRLSMLLRGLRDTQRFSASHLAGERFLLLDPSWVTFTPFAAANAGSDRYLKAPAVGAALSAVDPETLSFEASTLKPFSPAEFSMVREDSGDVTISWTRRTRAFVGPFSTAPAMSGETPEVYEVDLSPFPVNAAVRRTKIVTAATSCVYTAAEQLEDGMGTAWRLRARVYRISALVGRGNPAETTL